MSKERWVAEAPSNIALIKYMGKISQGGSSNCPANPSLSYTLNHLRTRVEIQRIDGEGDRWAPLEQTGWMAPELTLHGQKRYLDHFVRLKREMGISGFFKVRSANNFPGDAGLASSASSFAALTLATHELGKGCGERKDWTIEQLAELSRQGSGSSCRSFFKPWVLWDEKGVRSVDLGFEDLLHQVVVVEEGKKAVSSSQAHQKVESSLLYASRPERAQKRLDLLMESLKKKDWTKSFEVVWAEFFDMHALFETSEPSFGYMTADSFKVLSEVRAFWQRKSDGPLVTMDAGANVHLLYRPDQKDMADELAERFKAWTMVFAQ